MVKNIGSVRKFGDFFIRTYFCADAFKNDLVASYLVCFLFLCVCSDRVIDGVPDFWLGVAGIAAGVVLVGGGIAAFVRRRCRFRQPGRAAPITAADDVAANDDVYALRDVVGDVYARLGQRSDAEQREAEEEELERSADLLARMREFSRREAEKEREEKDDVVGDDNNNNHNKDDDEDATAPKTPFTEEEEEEEEEGAAYAAIGRAADAAADAVSGAAATAATAAIGAAAEAISGAAATAANTAIGRAAAALPLTLDPSKLEAFFKK